MHCGYASNFCQNSNRVTCENISYSIQNCIHQDDQTQPTFEMTPGFKPFTIFLCQAQSDKIHSIILRVPNEKKLLSTIMKN